MLWERKRATSATSFWNTAAVHDSMVFTDPENWTGGFYPSTNFWEIFEADDSWNRFVDRTKV